MMIKIKKDLLRNLCVLFISIIFSLLIGEFIIGYFLPQKLYDEFNQDSHFFYDKYATNDGELVFWRKTPLGWMTKPNISMLLYGENNLVVNYTTNSQGFRSDFDFNISKNNKIRVAFFGDSFMFGAGIDQHETLPFFVEELSNSGVESYNFGTGMFGFGQSYLLFLNQSLVYKPDVVVFSIFWNDLSDELLFNQSNYLRPIFTLVNKNGVGELYLVNFPAVFVDGEIKNSLLEGRKPKYFGLELFMMKYSHLYNVIKRINHENEFITMLKLLEEKEKNFFAYHPEFVWYNKKYKREVLSPFSRIICDLAVNASVIARENNMSSVFVYVPNRREVDVKHRNMLAMQLKKNGIGYDEDDFDYSQVARRFEGCFRENNLTHINLYYEFLNQTEMGVDELYNKYDIHWSPKATKFTAEKINSLLVDNN